MPQIIEKNERPVVNVRNARVNRTLSHQIPKSSWSQFMGKSSLFSVLKGKVSLKT
jgi:hypothetical protein